MRSKILIVPGFVFILVSFTQDESGTSYSIGNFKIQFIDHDLCSCGEGCTFTQQPSGIYVYAQPVKLTKDHILRVPNYQTFDSIHCQKRLLIAYGRIVSETEGIEFYDTSKSANKKLNDFMTYGEWKKIPCKKENQFDLKAAYEYKPMHYVRPRISKKEVDTYFSTYDTPMPTHYFYEKEFVKGAKYGQFVYAVQLKLIGYKNGKTTQQILHLRYLHGEC